LLLAKAEPTEGATTGRVAGHCTVVRNLA